MLVWGSGTEGGTSRNAIHFALSGLVVPAFKIGARLCLAITRAKLSTGESKGVIIPSLAIFRTRGRSDETPYMTTRHTCATLARRRPQPKPGKQSPDGYHEVTEDVPLQPCAAWHMRTEIRRNEALFFFFGAHPTPGTEILPLSLSVLTAFPKPHLVVNSSANEQGGLVHSSGEHVRCAGYGSAFGRDKLNLTQERQRS